MVNGNGTPRRSRSVTGLLHKTALIKAAAQQGMPIIEPKSCQCSDKRARLLTAFQHSNTPEQSKRLPLSHGIDHLIRR
jgi:hypothetical protein